MKIEVYAAFAAVCLAKVSDAVELVTRTGRPAVFKLPIQRDSTPSTGLLPRVISKKLSQTIDNNVRRIASLV